MFKQPPQKYKCPNCSYSEIFYPKDGYPILIKSCPKCKKPLKKVDMNFLDKLKTRKFF